MAHPVSASARSSSPVPFEMAVTLCQCTKGLEPVLSKLEKMTADSQVIVTRQQAIIHKLRQKLAKYEERDRLKARISSNKSPVTKKTQSKLEEKSNENVRSTVIKSRHDGSEHVRRGGMTMAEMAEELRIADVIAIEALGREREAWRCLGLAHSRIYELSANRLKEEARFKIPDVCPDVFRPWAAANGFQLTASQQTQESCNGLFDAAKKEIENEHALCLSYAAREREIQEEDLRHTVDKVWIAQICLVILIVSALILI